MEIIAHRGASAVAPENTVAAYRAAWEMGADAAETDVYLTRDNQVVAIHDETTKRTTGVDHEVKSTTYDELRSLDAGSWKDPRYAGEPIPLLSAILETLPPGKILYVEVKCGPEILPFLDEVLTKSGKRDQVTIIGFDLDTMDAAKKRMPDRPVFWLRSTEEDKETNVRLPHDLSWVDLVKARGLDGLDVGYGGLTPSFVEAARKAGLGLVVWTVNERADAIRMRDLGVDGLTTDHVDILTEAR